MTNKRLSNEFIEDLITVEAWAHMSEEFKWTEAMLEKYEKNINWDKLSSNGQMVWTQSILDKLKHKLNWNLLSDNSNNELFSDANLERYQNYWNWSIISEQRWLELSIETIKKFEHRWDWIKLVDSDNYSLSNQFETNLLELFISKVPISTLMDSSLWRSYVKAHAEEITQKIVSL